MARAAWFRLGWLLVVLTACGNTAGSATATSASSSTSAADTPTGDGLHDTLDDAAAAELAERYLSCVKDAGLVIEHVSVHDLPGIGIFVKTEIDVPAPIHGPCVELIGGNGNGQSSWAAEGT